MDRWVINTFKVKHYIEISTISKILASGYYIRNQREQFLEISTNMPSIGLVICEMVCEVSFLCNFEAKCSRLISKLPILVSLKMLKERTLRVAS